MAKKIASFHAGRMNFAEDLNDHEPNSGGRPIPFGRWSFVTSSTMAPRLRAEPNTHAGMQGSSKQPRTESGEIHGRSAEGCEEGLGNMDRPSSRLGGVHSGMASPPEVDRRNWGSECHHFFRPMHPGSILGQFLVVNDAMLPENIQPVVATNNTRRSSPADLGELSNDDVWDFEEPLLDLYHPIVHGKVLRGLQVANDDVWDFEESLAPFSSPTSEKNQLPDTM
ncbi:hypothetical protein THAR02_10270, partial [Trichoderma harzianum]